jgi:hypothetical protein
MQPAPVAFFAFRRPEHARRALESLAANALAGSSELFIYCDGPRNQADEEQVSAVRRLVRNRKWCGATHIVEREENFGLAASVIAGVSELVERFGKVIVVEDDLVLSPLFLDYMNTALNKYEEIENIYQVSAYMFDIQTKEVHTSFFLPLTTSWGWATWLRAWNHFDQSFGKLCFLDKERKLRKRFDLDGAYPYYQMAVAAREGKVDSWAIRWYLSVFLDGGLVLYPPSTLVENRGFDSFGTHCHTDSMLGGKLSNNVAYDLPNSVDIDSHLFKLVKSFLKKRRNPQ